MKKTPVMILSILSFLLLIIPSMATPSHSLYVKPANGGGTGPYVITSPATLEIGVHSKGHGTITNLQLLLILNNDTYNHLAKITTTVTSDFIKTDFINPESIPEPKIEHYNICALKSHIYGGNTDTPLWCHIKPTTISSISKASPATLTLTVDTPGATQMKVAVLAIGYSASLDHKGTGELNMCTALGETVFVVPEIASLFLALAPVSSLGLYMYKQKKNSKAT